MLPTLSWWPCLLHQGVTGADPENLGLNSACCVVLTPLVWRYSETFQACAWLLFKFPSKTCSCINSCCFFSDNWPESHLPKTGGIKLVSAGITTRYLSRAKAAGREGGGVHVHQMHHPGPATEWREKAFQSCCADLLFTPGKLIARLFCYNSTNGIYILF